MNINEVNEIKENGDGHFPTLMKAYQKYGITKFQTYATTAKSVYFDVTGNSVSDESAFFNFSLGELDVEKFREDLLKHQKAEIGFPTWLQRTAESGIAYWVVSLADKTCTYYDMEDRPVHVEEIPGL